MQLGHNHHRRLLADTSAAEYFISVGNGTSFYNGCSTFFVAGWNEYAPATQNGLS